MPRETLEGRIVRLEPLEARHAAALEAAAASSPESFRYFPSDLSRPEAFAAWLERALSGSDLPFATCDAETGEPVGSSWLMTHVPEHRRIEIGNTWLVSGCWGTGANTEAKYLMLEHAFERLGVHRVEFKTEAANARSCAALAALPAEFEGIHRKHMLVRDGVRRDSAWYSVVDDDWPAVRKRLLARIASQSRGNAGPGR